MDSDFLVVYVGFLFSYGLKIPDLSPTLISLVDY